MANIGRLDGQSVIVTGGCGAIGSQLVRRLLRENCAEVVAVDDLSSGYEGLLPQDERVRFLLSDVCDLPRLPLEMPGAIAFHLAALTGRQLIQWLKSQGAKPLDPATRKRLKAAGNLGMPAE